MKKLLLVAVLMMLAVPARAYTVGFIGCSNTMMSVGGYHLATGNKNRLWPPYQTGGGAVSKWADPASSYWTFYKQQIALYGQPQKVWVQLCENVLAQVGTYTQVQEMLANLKAISPQAVFYISAINIYNPFAGLCSFMGATGQGETDTINWASQAVAANLARAGPSMGPLTAAMLQSDRCHPTKSAATTVLGPQLVNFFDVP